MEQLEMVGAGDVELGALVAATAPLVLAGWV